MSRAEYYRKKFGKSEDTTELQAIYNEIESIGEKCQSYIHHTPLSYDTLKQLRKEGFSVNTEGGAYIITW
jgi:hypothetical protein